jgi:hypothetical protein
VQDIFDVVRLRDHDQTLTSSDAGGRR